MSRFFSSKYKKLTPYTPGEQPQDQTYVKLNTNESPFPPSEKALAYASENTRPANLYCDPACKLLFEEFAKAYNVSPANVIAGNGSDDLLNFAFMAFCDEQHPAAFPDITYGFYPVFAELNNVPYETIPLKDDFSIDPKDYIGCGKTVFIANPNAPTGMMLPLECIEKIAESNPDNVVIVDEAYVDFGGVSAVELTKKHDNILVIMTFSKSRSMAGARLGFAIGCEALIQDLNTIKYSTNPYNINSYTQALAVGTLRDSEYTEKNCRTIIENREYLCEKLKALGFELTDSCANFVFAKHKAVSGEEIYRKLKEKGVLVRHFTTERIKDHNRITIGTKEQLDILLEKLGEIL